MATPAIANNALIGEEVIPGTNFSSDAQILQGVKGNGHMFYHASATCMMGLANDSMAVVDSHARLFSVQTLRVVDFPFLPFGHPHATVYALVEMIVRFILDGK